LERIGVQEAKRLMTDAEGKVHPTHKVQIYLRIAGRAIGVGPNWTYLRCNDSM
jgi:hypothetical protein